MNARRTDRYFAGTFLLCAIAYYLIFARLYISGIIVHGHDTHGMWTAPYLAFYSIKEWGEFSWWDPTGLNGWPIFNVLLNWTYAYFSPYAVPYLVAFKIVSYLARVDGREVPIYRADFTFKAIELPAGEHIIEWVFNPYPVKIAWSLFYVSFFAYGFLMWRCFARARGDGHV